MLRHLEEIESIVLDSDEKTKPFVDWIRANVCGNVSYGSVFTVNGKKTVTSVLYIDYLFSEFLDFESKEHERKIQKMIR